MNSIANTLSLSFPDWKSIYNKVQKSAIVPDTASEVISKDGAVIRDIYVNLAEVYDKFQTQGINPTTVLIYADVLHIPAKYNGVLDGTALLIAARRIEVVEPANVLLNYGSTDKTAALVMYTDELVGSLQAVAVTSEDIQQMPTVFSIDSVDSKGVQIAFLDDQPTLQPLDVFQGSMLEVGSDFHLSLVSIFQFATLLFDDEPNIARAMLSWIQTSTAESNALIEMFLQSSSLRVMAEAASEHVNFVPSLHQELYAESAKAFVAAAEAYEKQYERFSDKNEAIEDRKEAANLMLSHYQDTTEFTARLLEQTQHNLEKAKAAVMTASNHLRFQHNKVDQAKIALQYGIKEWEYEKKLEAALQGSVKAIEALLSFAAAIPAMFAGQPEIAAVAVAEVPATMRTLAQVMEILNNVTAALQTLLTASQQLEEAAKTFSQTEALTNLTDQLDDMGSVGLDPATYWSKFKLETEALLKKAIDNDVPGAQDYKLQLDLLVVYGQSLATNQLAVTQISQELVRLILQKQVSEKQQQRLSNYIKNLSDREQPNTEIMRLFYQQYLDVKRSLYVALKSYCWAYKYWALKEPGFELSIANSVADLRNDLANIQKDYVKAVDCFDPRPQPFLRITHFISDPQVIQGLQEKGEAMWSIDLDHSEFIGCDRVRVTNIRVWLEGAKPQGKRPIYISISNTGYYCDRLKGQTYHFTAAPLHRIFQYWVTPVKEDDTLPHWKFSNGQFGYVKVDGKVVDELKYAYFEPTAFSNWKISLPKAENEGIDLSGITQIGIVFTGSVIGTV